MAYTLEEEDDQLTGMAPTQLTAPNANGTPAAPTGSPAQAAGKPKQGSGFVGWDQILNANKDSASAQAGKIAAPMAAAGQQSQSNLAAHTKDYTHAANSRMPAPAPINYAAPAPNGTLATPKPVASPTLPGAKPLQAAGKGPLAPQPAPAPVAAGGLQSAPLNPNTPPAYGQGAADSTHLETAGEKRERELSGKPAPTKVSAAKQAELDAVTSKQAPYSGPKSVAEIDGWDSLLSGASESDRNISNLQQRGAGGNLQGDAGIAALLQGKAPMASAANQFDAALIGATGRKRFKELDRDYGGLLKQHEAAARTTGADAAARTAQVAGDTRAAQARLSAYQGTQTGKRTPDQMKEDDALLLKGYMAYQNIQAETNPAMKAVKIEQYNREYGGRGDSDAYARSEAAAARAQEARNAKAMQDAKNDAVNGRYEEEKLRKGKDVVTSDHYTFS